MNESDLREALQRVPPVDIDDQMIATAIREARTRRFRLVVAAVGILVVVGLVGGLAVWRSTSQTVAVPDPRASVTVAPTPTTSNPTMAPPSPSLTATADSTRAASSTRPSTTPPATATYSGPVDLLPASFGTVRVKVTADGPVGRAAGYERSDASLVICGLIPSSAPSLRRLTAAATVVRSAGESYEAQSVLEFSTTADATAFVAELRTIQAACPSGTAFTPATRPIPPPVPSMADEGVVVGSYVPGGQDGSALYVARKGKVVVAVLLLVCADLAKTAQSETDHIHTGPILDVLSQI